MIGGGRKGRGAPHQLIDGLHEGLWQLRLVPGAVGQGWPADADALVGDAEVLAEDAPVALRHLVAALAAPVLLDLLGVRLAERLGHALALPVPVPVQLGLLQTLQASFLFVSSDIPRPKALRSRSGGACIIQI